MVNVIVNFIEVSQIKVLHETLWCLVETRQKLHSSLIKVRELSYHDWSVSRVWKIFGHCGPAPWGRMGFTPIALMLTFIGDCSAAMLPRAKSLIENFAHLTGPLPRECRGQNLYLRQSAGKLS